jgi:hypothetical protein
MSNYEVLPDMTDQTGEETLSASWTPNNGRKIMIIDTEVSDEAAHFHLSKEQAIVLGKFLLRCGEDDH